MGRLKGFDNRKGFTLVELAIVLVIIGIILGAVLKGQGLIDNAKMKRTITLQKEIAAAVYTYYDRYAYYPGDDLLAGASRGFSSPTVTSGDGNGLVAAAGASTPADFACAATGTEQCDLWAELRQAGFINGSGFANPTHPYGGGVAMTYFSMTVVGGGSALLAHWIIFQNIPYDVCQILDRLYDDGVAGTGTIRSTTTDYMTATSGVFAIGFKL